MKKKGGTRILDNILWITNLSTTSLLRAIIQQPSKRSNEHLIKFAVRLVLISYSLQNSYQSARRASIFTASPENRLVCLPSWHSLHQLSKQVNLLAELLQWSVPASEQVNLLAELYRLLVVAIQQAG
jgi:hypothetical protein